jgi:hypothetical protein
MKFKITPGETTETTGFVSQFIKYGCNKLKINHIELRDSSTGKKLVKIWVETEPLPGNFEGAELQDGTKAKGLVGKVSLGIYIDTANEAKVTGLLNNLKFVAEKANVLTEVAAIEASTLEEFMAKYVKIIKGKYMWFIIKAREYEKGKYDLSFKEGKIGEDKDGNKVYQVFCKNGDFKDSKDTEGIVVKEDIIYEVKGQNVIGKSSGKSDTLVFDPSWDLKEFETSDTEDADISTDISTEDMTDF